MPRVFVATRKGLFVYSIESTTLVLESEHFLGDPVSSFAVDDAGHWYAALNLGHFGPKMKKSTDEGVSWTDVSCPSLPLKPEADETSSQWLVQQVWVLEAIPGQPGCLLAGTIPGALFMTSDGANSWQLNESLWQVPERTKWMGGGFDESGVHSIAVYGDHSDHWTIAVSVGGVWHSEDSGGSWQLKCKGMNAAYMPEDMADAEEVQDPHRLVQSPSMPSRMWVQHHCGIFVSDDYGKNWRECFHNGQSVFGFTVAVHPKDPDVAWFVPGLKDESRYPKNGQLKVLKTNNGGVSFEEHSLGLPQQHCFDLVYRHALVVDDTGERLVFASTTGNLWLSLNGGNQWQVVSHYLPPVYTVVWK